MNIFVRVVVVYSEAAAQWSKSVAQGDAEAMNNLGYLLYNGFGVDKDTDRAVKLWVHCQIWEAGALRVGPSDRGCRG